MTTMTPSIGKKPKKSGLLRYKERWGMLFISPWVIGFLLFYLIPMVASFGFSLMDFNLATPEEARFVAFDNWHRAFIDDEEVIVPASRRVPPVADVEVHVEDRLQVPQQARRRPRIADRRREADEIPHVPVYP